MKDMQSDGGDNGRDNRWPNCGGASFVAWAHECGFVWLNGEPARHHLCGLDFEHPGLHVCYVCGVEYSEGEI